MIINKPLFHIIKQNDINYIEINDEHNKINNKNKNIKMYNSNDKLEEIKNNEIIENYPYEFFEEENINNIKDNKKLQYIISDTEPQPEPDQPLETLHQYINLELNKNKVKESKNEDVIDFDDESIFVTNDKSEGNNMNLNLNKKDNLKNNNLKSINQINLNFEKNDKNQKYENENIISNIHLSINSNEFKKEKENINKDNNKETNIINYSLDQEEIADILNLDKKTKEKQDNKINGLNINENQNIILGNEELSKIILNKTKLLQNLYEKEMKYKNAYKEYCKQLSETMNNEYFKDKDILENVNINSNNNINAYNTVYNNEKNKINNDYLIHHQTNTINDINIFCLNNNNNSNNYLNFNEPKSQTFELKNNKNNKNINMSNINNIKQANSEPYFNNMISAYEQYKKVKLNKMALNKDKKKTKINTDYIRHPTIILSIRKFLNEYNISVQNKVKMEFSKNPDFNYETYIDILNDLNYIDKKKLAQMYFINISIYKNIWNFLLKIKNQKIKNEEYNLESNLLLIFLLLLNGFFNNIKIIDELEIELSWLKFENYEQLIMKNDYIEENYKELIDIRKNNLLMKANLNNLFIINNNQKKYERENNSKGPDDVLSEYFNSYTNNNINNGYNTISHKIKNKKEKKIYNYSANKLLEKKNHQQKKINTNNINNKLYAFKPRNNSSLKINNLNQDLSKSLKKNKSYSSSKLNKVLDINQLQLEKIDNIIINNEIRKEKNLKRNKLKKNILKTNNINYNELYNLSKVKDDLNDIHINAFINNQLSKKPSNKNIIINNLIKGKSGNYSNKVKQNRTDLKKLFKNNEYKDGPINERLEKIKRQRQNSKPKGVKIQINYEEYTNLDKFKDKNENQKPKYQFKKHIPQKKSNIFYNFKINEKEYVLEHKSDENIEIEIMQLMQKNNISGISAKSILEKIKFSQKSNSSEIK